MDPVIYRTANGEIHRDGGLPAIECSNGLKEWWVNGQYHRENDLPAIDWFNGTKSWWVNGLRHRDGGLPAVENANGLKEWWVNGKLHRDGGLPAIEWPRGSKEWYVNGKRLSKEKALTYFSFCQKMQDKRRIRAQKKIYFWWIQICYDLDHHSGCGKRMALRNLDVFETMMKV